MATLSYASVEMAVVECSRNPSYVSPVDPETLGKRAFRVGLMIKDWWSAEIQNGWEMAFNRCVDGVALEDYKAADALIEAIG